MESDEPEEPRPYKGIGSYQPEDGDLFFGRDQEAQRLVATILSTRTTVLQASSGAGKTSLLNTLVIPDLESHGWTPVRARPEANPMVALRDAALEWVIVNPRIEAAALKRAADRLAPNTSDPPLVDLVGAFDALGERHPVRRLGASAFKAAPRHGSSSPADAPFFGRVLRKSLTLERYQAHLKILAGRRTDPALASPLTAGRLRDFFASPEILRRYDDLLKALILPVPGLAPFFTNLWETHAAQGVHLDFVLVLDQFEELFTRFVDRQDEVPLARPDYHLRRLFFEEIRSLYQLRLPAAAGRGGGDAPRGDFPLRVVISMREEYLGRLYSLRQVVPDLDEQTVRLDFLDLGEAKRAIAGPARLFGYRYEPRCYQEIIEGLVREKATGADKDVVGGYVEPTALQIVCDRLWDSIARAKLATQSGGDAEIRLEEVQDLVSEADRQPGRLVPGIIADYLRRLLLPWSPETRFEALDLLESLIIGGRYRNIVPRSTLVQAPFRNAALREAVLGELVAARVLRSEPKLGSDFVEIAHEFLIPAILVEVQAHVVSHPEVSRLRAANRILDRVLGPAGDEPDGALTRKEVELIYTCRRWISWTPAAAARLLRAAITLGSDREAVSFWIDLYRRTDGLEASRQTRPGGAPPDTREAWRSQHAWFEEQEGLSLPVLEALLRAALRWAGSSERDAVRSWTQRYLDHDKRSAAHH